MRARRYTNQVIGSTTGGGYTIGPLPKVGPTPAIGPPAQGGVALPGDMSKPPASDPMASLSSLLSGDVMGIPVKYILIGVAAYFLMKKH